MTRLPFLKTLLRVLGTRNGLLIHSLAPIAACACGGPPCQPGHVCSLFWERVGKYEDQPR